MRRHLDDCGAYDAKVGDTVYIRATVVGVPRSEELLVELLSKTDQFRVRVRAELCELDLPDLPDEPADKTMLLCKNPDDGVQHVFRRDDAEGHNDRDTRRHDRHWWSYVDQSWVDWAYVVKRGGANGRTLTVGPSGPAASGEADREADREPPFPILTPDERRALEEVVDLIPRGRGRTFHQIGKMAARRGVFAARELIVQYLEWRQWKGDVRFERTEPHLADRWVAVDR